MSARLRVPAVPSSLAMLLATSLAVLSGGCATSSSRGLPGADGAAGAKLRQVAAAPVMPPLERWADVARAAAGGARCEGLVTDPEGVEVPPMARPPPGEPYLDPVFGTRVTRVTDARPGEVFKPAYSTMQAWNADESLLLLYRGGVDPGHVLLDGHTYAFVAELPFVPVDVEEIWWSHADPKTLFYVDKGSSRSGELRRYDVTAGRAVTLHDFGDLCGIDLPVAGGDAQMQSLDDDLFGFRCRTGEGEHAMIAWRAAGDDVVSRPIGGTSRWDAWSAPVPAPDGESFWLQGRTLAPDLERILARADVHKASEHSNVGQASDGAPALFATAFDPSPGGCDGDPAGGVGHLVEHRLEDGSCRPVVNEAGGWPYTTSGTHVSARATGQPGLVAMSSVGYGSLEQLGGGVKAPALFSEIYLVDTDPASGEVCRLAHHRSHGKSATNATYKPYFGEPHATVSPSGTRVAFGSDWHDSGSVDAYVVELPGHVEVDPEAGAEIDPEAGPGTDPGNGPGND